MSFNHRVKNGRNVTAEAPLTSGPHLGAVVLMGRIVPGTLCAEIRATLTAPGLLLTPSWQVSDDGSRWVDARQPNNAGNVPLVTGEHVLDMAAPLSLSAHRFARVVLTTSGAEPGADDVAGSRYSWLEGDV